MDNCLVLSGRIVKREQTRRSPAGLPITQLVLEHLSKQIEAGFAREARCRMAVTVCGGPLHQQAEIKLVIGAQIRVTGFISRVSHRHGESRIILHAEKIEFLES